MSDNKLREDERADLFAGLADRVEGLSGPDREVDALVWLALVPGATRKERRYLHTTSGTHQVIDETRENGRLITVPAYTASIDAAMTLMPEGSLFTTRTLWDRDKVTGFASISRYETGGPDDALRRYWMDEHQCNAATPALALAAASLRAIAGGTSA